MGVRNARCRFRTDDILLVRQRREPVAAGRFKTVTGFLLPLHKQAMAAGARMRWILR